MDDLVSRVHSFDLGQLFRLCLNQFDAKGRSDPRKHFTKPAINLLQLDRVNPLDLLEPTNPLQTKLVQVMLHLIWCQVVPKIANELSLFLNQLLEGF